LVPKDEILIVWLKMPSDVLPKKMFKPPKLLPAAMSANGLNPANEKPVPGPNPNEPFSRSAGPIAMLETANSAARPVEPSTMVPKSNV